MGERIVDLKRRLNGKCNFCGRPVSTNCFGINSFHKHLIEEGKLQAFQEMDAKIPVLLEEAIKWQQETGNDPEDVYGEFDRKLREWIKEKGSK